MTDNELNDIQNALVHAADRTLAMMERNKTAFTSVELDRRGYILTKLRHAAYTIGAIRAKMREGEEL